MKNVNRSLQIKQLDKKMKSFGKLITLIPARGWVYTVRTTLGMSLEQLGKKLGITAQSVREIEQREREGSVSLKTLKEVARVLNLNLVYGFSVPKINLEKMIKLRARILAENIVFRTHRTMELENQANSQTRLHQAIKERAAEIISQNIKQLWD